MTNTSDNHRIWFTCNVKWPWRPNSGGSWTSLFPNFKKPKRNTTRSSWDRETAQICKKIIKTVRPRTILHWVAPVARRSRQGWDILQCCLCCTSATLPANVWHDTLPHLSGRQWLESGALEEAKLKAKLPWSHPRNYGKLQHAPFSSRLPSYQVKRTGPRPEIHPGACKHLSMSWPCHGHVMAMFSLHLCLSCLFHVFFMSFSCLFHVFFMSFSCLSCPVCLAFPAILASLQIDDQSE